MEHSEKIKNRLAVIMWLILSVNGILAISSGGASKSLVFILVLIVFGSALCLSLTVASTRTLIRPALLFIIIVAFVLTITFISHFSPLREPLSLSFIILLVSTAFYFQPAEAIILTALMSMMEAILLYLPEKSMVALVSTRLLITVTGYFFIVLVAGIFSSESRQELRAIDGEAEKLKKSLSDLGTEKAQVEKEKARAEKEKAQVENEKDELTRIQEKLNAEVSRRESLHQITCDFTQTLDSSVISRQLIEILKSSLPFETGGVFLVDRGRHRISCAAAKGPFKDEMQNQLNDISENILAIIAEKNELSIFHSIEEDPRFDKIAGSTQVKSALYAPISLDAEVYGVICFWSATRRAFSDISLEFFKSVIYEAARAFKNAEVYRMLDTRFNFIITLWNATKKLASVSDLSNTSKNVLRQVIETIRVLFDADGVIHYFYEPSMRIFVPFVVTSQGIIHNPDLMASAGIATEHFGQLVMNAKKIEEGELLEGPLHVPNVNFSTSKGKVFSTVAKIFDVTSLYWYPLAVRENVLGALVFLFKTGREWTKEESQLVDIFYYLYTLSIENLELVHGPESKERDRTKELNNGGQEIKI
ncbi:MAG: GAF domain-containing protein [Candidatus Eremiobacteraeota bacterium]|nr:GAF domain-containing protein [Candidatus Eremiobacteraeota bacterium]